MIGGTYFGGSEFGDELFLIPAAPDLRPPFVALPVPPDPVLGLAVGAGNFTIAVTSPVGATVTTPPNEVEVL